MTRHRRQLTTLAAAVAAVVGAMAMTAPAEAGRRVRTGCDRSYVRYDSSRDRAVYRARWQAGQYGSHFVHQGRVYSDGFCGTNEYRCDGRRPSRGHHVRADRPRGRRHRQR